MKNKKGFTLVELLAVMVILIIIIIIAYAVIKRNVDETLDNTIKANAGIYIKAANALISEKSITDASYDSGLLSVSQLDSEGVKISGTKPDSGYVSFYNSEITDACLEYDGYYIDFSNGNLSDPSKGNCGEIQTEFTYSYKGDFETFTAPVTSNYKVELWGAAGGKSTTLSGLGGYTVGTIYLTKGEKLYVYVGEQSDGAAVTFNGGGSCVQWCSPGGGATDVRLISGTWNNEDSLSSRIMVAGGGGGYNLYDVGSTGGFAGGLEGRKGYGRGVNNGPFGGSQIAGGDRNITSASGTWGVSGTFGVGGNAGTYGGGGGGGYYGGGGGSNGPSTGGGETAGGGGSSYISGHAGCVAIKSAELIEPKDDCVGGTNDIECSLHFSGKKFTNTNIIDGSSSMPTYDGTSTMVGNYGNGYAKITLVK